MTINFDARKYTFSTVMENRICLLAGKKKRISPSVGLGSWPLGVLTNAKPLLCAFVIMALDSKHPFVDQKKNSKHPFRTTRNI